MSTNDTLNHVGLWSRVAHRARSLTGKIASSIMLIVVWLLFLALGNSLHSDDYSPRQADGVVSFLRLIFFYLVSWTWTNVGVLACVAAALGESGRDIQSDARSDYRRALVNGFYAYLVVTAGYLVSQGGLNLVDQHPEIKAKAVSPDDWTRTTAQFTYARIALTVSIASFIAGYAPNYIKSLLVGFANRLQVDGQGGSQGTSPIALEENPVVAVARREPLRGERTRSEIPTPVRGANEQ